jgi:hypothetical protein
MNPSRTAVPTLTEVVQIAGNAPAITLDELQAAPETDAAVDTVPALDEAQLLARVLDDVQRQIDPMLEYRLRESLSPALARLTESLVQEMRGELASTLREVIERAVALELARQRAR